jgi:transposase
MLAIALVLEGVHRATAAETCGMDRQTLRDWVHRYNAEGLAGLVNRTVPHRPRRLVPAQRAELAAWVEAGPNPARSAVDCVVLWRRKDLQHSIEAAFGVILHERTVGKQLAALGYRRLSVRPQHPKSNQLLTFAWNRCPFSVKCAHYNVKLPEWRLNCVLLRSYAVSGGFGY